MKILVIGEICKDIFVYGKIKRLSPEAPVPVFNPFMDTANDGMAGNVVENLKSLSDFEIKFIHQSEEIKKTRYVDYKSNHMFIRVDEGEDNISRIHINEDVLKDILESDAVIVSDYDKGFLHEDDIMNIGYHSKFCLLDTKKKLHPNTIGQFDFIKLNESEFNYNQIKDEDLLERIIITIGSNGAKYMNQVYPSPSPRETIDVSGAGDTFLSAFTVKYLETKDTPESIRYANEMSAIVVSKRGVVTP